MTDAASADALQRPARDIAADAGRRRGPLWATALGVALLTAAGVGHRLLEAEIERSVGQIVRPKAPLESLPLRLGSWVGREDPIDERVTRIWGFDDDHVSRIYASREHEQAINLFIGYVGRPRVSMGHRPDKCYAAHGWTQVSEQPVTVTAPSGRRVPSVLYEFKPPASALTTGGAPDRMFVLATYMINGRYAQDPAELNQYNTRQANLFGARPAYLTRIQASLPSRGARAAEVAALEQFTGLIAEATIALMPYWEPKSSEGAVE